MGLTLTHVRPARGDETAQLSALALRSKAHWGYSAEFLEACRDELTYTPRDIETALVHVAEVAGVVVGFSVVRPDPPGGELAALFVDPPVIGSGVGGQLLRHALRRAGEAGVETLTLDADPDAEPFYLHVGARRVGEAASGSIPRRMLPRLAIDTFGSALTG